MAASGSNKQLHWGDLEEFINIVEGSNRLLVYMENILKVWKNVGKPFIKIKAVDEQIDEVRVGIRIVSPS